MNNQTLTRRDILRRIGGGFGALGLSSVFAEAGFVSASPAAPAAAASNPLAPKAPHFAARAKRVIFLFMNGGPSHVDTFDPKPGLTRMQGQPLPAGFRAGSARRNDSPLMGTPFR